MPHQNPISNPAPLRDGLSTDLLIVGGGVNGLGVAWDASLRGLKVIVVEQADVGQGTTGRYHGLLHSGARFAVSDPQTAADCASENLILRRIAAGCIEDTGGYYLATPADPVDYADRWLAACLLNKIPAEEIPVERARRFEPSLSPRLSRAFQVNDAALDSFELARRLVAAIRRAGGLVCVHHRVSALIRDGDRITGAEIVDLRRGVKSTIGASFVVNVAGPWAQAVARLARIDLPLTYAKGTMVAMASRPVHTVLNRCKPPSDGDIIVPIGSVIVLGTTDEPVHGPTDLRIHPWEIDLLLAEAEFILPGLRQARVLRAWAGIRPLFDATSSFETGRRGTPLGHALLDHEKLSGCAGFVSIIGGNLTTFRSLSEKIVDLICSRLERTQPSLTKTTGLALEESGHYRLPSRLERMRGADSSSTSNLVCECELIDREQILLALDDPDNMDMDALRRDLRLGMGPCQAAFCALRTYGLLTDQLHTARIQKEWRIQPFLEERWKGQRPVGWGHSLRQMDLSRRLYQEFLGLRQEKPA
jgi:glycerol-3-phosphate dehydrogenase